VTEVLIGLLRADPASYLTLEPGWQPSLPAAGPHFTLADLITLATCTTAADHLDLHDLCTLCPLT
jgi:hypothetical protein